MIKALYKRGGGQMFEMRAAKDYFRCNNLIGLTGSAADVIFSTKPDVKSQVLSALYRILLVK